MRSKCMKKLFFLITLFFSVSFISRAQSDSTIKKQTYHGVVKNEKNKPIQNASVIVEGDEKGTTTDAEGFFKINAQPNAKLVITADGYQSSLTPVRNAQFVQLVSIKNKSNSDNTDELIKQQSVSNDFKNYATAESSRNYTGSYLTTFKENEATVGSRFLFDKWANGKLIDKNNNDIVAKDYKLNYDKMGGKLLATNDQKTIIELDDTALSGYSFTDPTYGKEVLFKKVKLDDKNKFLIMLVGNGSSGYTLYKDLKTEFVRANYTNNGLIQSGHNYDEYVDKPVYYILLPGSNELTKIELKEKAIKKTLIANEARVKTFFSSHAEGKIDEDMLIQLISFLNQESNRN